MTTQGYAGERGSEGRLPLNWRVPSYLFQALHFQCSRTVLFPERFRSLEAVNFFMDHNNVVPARRLYQ
jgi:hypothetical protein